jgi:large subunit ribosomal protein L6
MSRIGKAPIPVPAKVDVSLEGLTVTVKGPKGELRRTLPDGIAIAQEGETLVVSPTGPSRRSRERHGLCRTLVANMVEGVSQGFVRKLEIVGVGYRASVQGQKLVVSAGYSHPVEMEPPAGVTFAVENNTTVLVSGPDKELVGNEAAKVRAIRPPEPYKGKGIKYEGERILRKAGKTGKK